MLRFSRSAAVGAVLLSLAACSGDGTGVQKEPDLSLEVTAHPGETYIIPTENGPAVGCNFTYALNPVGDAGASAAWTGGTLRFFVGADRTTPFDSLALTPEEMNEALGAGVRAGTPQSGQIGFLASVPYGLEAEFRYAVQGSGRAGSAKAYAPCTVAVQDGGVPPAVSNLQVSVHPGLPLEAGDVVRVTWTATSTTGLWESGVVLTGGFEAQYREGAPHQKSKTFTAEFTVPRNAVLGEPVRVHAYARDLLVRSAPAASVTGAAVADVTAPVLAAATTTGMYGDHLRGEYEAGRMIEVQVYAQDRGRLAYLVYEAGPVGATVRDSVALDTVSSQAVGLPTRAGWSGEGELRLYVRDNAGNRSRTVQSARGDIRFFGARQVQTREITLPFQPVAFAVDGSRGQVAVAARQQQRLYVYGLQGLAQTAAVELSFLPTRVEFAPDGRVAVLLRGAVLAFVDVAGQRVDRYVGLSAAPVDSIYGFGITAAGRALVLARRSGGGAAVVLEYDPATNTQRVRTDAPAVPFPEAGVATSLDRSRLLLGAGCVYRADTDGFGPCAPLWPSNQYQGGGFTGSGTGAYWADHGRLFDASLRELRAPGAAALSADDRYAFRGDFDRILRVRTADGRVEEALTTFLRGPTRATADGRLLVSMEEGGAADGQNHLQVIELP
jgi:hypothetical protein